MTQNQVLLRKCLNEIEAKLNWIDSGQWQQKHFESLSELIFNKTKVSLSPLTLKRLWGKTKYNSNPSASTLDALVRFLDYRDWIDFESSQKRKLIGNPGLHVLKYKKTLIITGIILGGLVVAVGVMRMISQTVTKNYSDFEFSVQKLSSKIPNTVYFKYDVRKTDADSVIIQQSWNPKFHHLVDKNKTDFSCIYYYPGYYKAKLVLDKTVVSQQDLYIKSNGWLGIVDKEPVPVYLPTEEIITNDILAITEDQLLEAGFDLINKIPQVTINLVEKFDNLKGNNFELQARFKHTYPKGDAICQKTQLMILCSDGYFYIPFSTNGCVNELKMYIPDKVLDAKIEDLRNLGFENSSDINLKLSVSKGVFDLKINDNQNILDTLTIDPGKIVGIKFGFHGTGEVQSFNLKSGNKTYSLHDFMP